MHCSICGSSRTNCSTCPDNPNNHGRYNFKKHFLAKGLYINQHKVITINQNDDITYITNILNKHCICDICDVIAIEGLKTCGTHGLQYCSKHLYCVICNRKLIENICMNQFSSELFDLSISTLSLDKLNLDS